MQTEGQALPVLGIALGPVHPIVGMDQVEAHRPERSGHRRGTAPVHAHDQHPWPGRSGHAPPQRSQPRSFLAYADSLGDLLTFLRTTLLPRHIKPDRSCLAARRLVSLDSRPTDAR